MATWKRICCPVDFSPVSRHAADEAAELAWRFGSKITLLHVVELPPVPAPDVRLPPREGRELSRAERERSLGAWRNAIEQIATTRVEAAITEGEPAAEIVRFAREAGADVIVMGTHGRERGPLGSVAAKVVLDAGCPVVVVREARSSAGAARAA